MHSCLYEGRVEHRRFEPVAHRFRYPLYMTYLDLEEAPALVRSRGPLSERRFSAASYLRSDHFGDPRLPLATAVRDLVEERTGVRPGGPIRMLANLRNFGYYFSPINLFYVFDASDTRIEFVAAEVTNTPWLETHCYVLWEGNRRDPVRLAFRDLKRFHVSPFMPMHHEYRWRLIGPSDSLVVHIENVDLETAKRLFFATLSLKRLPLDRSNLRGVLLRHPWMTARAVAAIYQEALGLWVKGCPYLPHPKDKIAKPPTP